MQCPKCGYDNSDEALFCNLCHTVFRKESPERPEVSPEEERYTIMHKYREGRGWKRWFALDVWVSLIVILGVAFWATKSMRKGEKIEEKPKLEGSNINSGFSPPDNTSSPFPLAKRETSHFVIYCNDETLANEIATKVERYYEIPTDLGLDEGKFWMKDKNKVSIYIYDTPQQYFQVTRRDCLRSGYSDFKTRSIYTYKGVDHIIEAVIPHELTHLIFADFMEFSLNYPNWVTEGLAMYEENKYCKAYIDNYQKILDQMKRGNYFSIEVLTKIDISKEKRLEVIHLWCVEAMSLVTYLIDVYGRGKFYIFCKNLKEGRDLNKSLENAYSPDIRGLAELTERWLNYIKTHEQKR